LLSLALCGCASEAQLEESAWQSLHMIDALQTAAIHRHHGLYEAESAWAIGHEPSGKSVAAYFGSEAALHAITAHYLAPHPLALRLFESVTIYDSGQCIVGNFELGLRF
jgi:hypothetical protein